MPRTSNFESPKIYTFETAYVSASYIITIFVYRDFFLTYKNIISLSVRAKAHEKMAHSYRNIAGRDSTHEAFDELAHGKISRKHFAGTVHFCWKRHFLLIFD